MLEEELLKRNGKKFFVHNRPFKSQIRLKRLWARSIVTRVMSSISEHIECSADVCNGKPVFRGTRVTVQTILSHLSAGDTVEDVLDAFPRLSREDVLACLAYAARVGGIHSSIELVS